MAILNRAIKNAQAMMRAAEFGDSSIPPNSGLGGIKGRGQHGEDAALGISTVLSCVKALHDDLKSLPFYAYTGDPNGAREPLKVQPRIVAEPFGPDLDPASGIGQLVVSHAMRGNAYAFVVSRDDLGYPDQLAVLHPDSVRPTRQDGVKVFKVGRETFSTQEIIHVTGLLPPGAVAGVDILTAQRTNLELAESVGEFAKGFFGSGGAPSGVISVPGPGDRRRAREVKEAWEDNHAGLNNAHRPAVMFGGATWTQVSVTPDNAQFLQTRMFLREEICGWFSVPLQRVQAVVENASQGGGKGLDAIDAGYVKHGLLPIARSLESVWDRMIPNGRASTWTGFDFDVYLRASAEIRAAVGSQHRTGGIRTIDEIRAEEGWAPLPNGQGSNPFTPLNSNVAPAAPAN